MARSDVRPRPAAHFSGTSDSGVPLYPTLLTITVNAGVADGAPVRFRIARAFLQDVDSLELRPPDALKALEEQTALFEVVAVGGRGHVELRYNPGRPGVLKTTVIPERAEGSQVWQLIYF